MAAFQTGAGLIADKKEEIITVNHFFCEQESIRLVGFFMSWKLSKAFGF